MDHERYEILDVIGSGGMATVWRARDTLLDRLVAIKRPDRVTDESAASARFSREARAAAAVAHPHLVAIHDVGVDETGPYLVMELVDGPSLATADVTDDRIAQIGSEIASALAALHAAGIVHRDVKPANILLAPDGAKLTDFGIARAAHDTATLTQPGTTFGTPAYAAPELITTGERTAASDVYSLAVTLHELLTGSRWNPMTGSTQAMPTGEWAPVLAPALSERPSDRPSAAAFADSLSRLASGSGGAAQTTPMLTDAATTRDTVGGPTIGGEPTGRRLAVGVFLAGVLALGVVAALVFRRADDGVTAHDPSTSTASDAAATTAVPPTTPPATTAPATTAPATATPATTSPATATPVTTSPVTTTPTTVAPSVVPTTRPEEASTSDPASELIALIEGVPPPELKPNDAKDIVKRIDDVVRVAAREPDETEKKLAETAEQISKHLDDSATRDRAEALLIELADDLGVPGSAVTDAFERDD